MKWCKVCKSREWDGPDGEPVCANEWCGDIKRLRAEVRRLRKALRDLYECPGQCNGCQRCGALIDAALARRPR